MPDEGLVERHVHDLLAQGITVNLDATGERLQVAMVQGALPAAERAWLTAAKPAVVAYLQAKAWKRETVVTRVEALDAMLRTRLDVAQRHLIHGILKEAGVEMTVQLRPRPEACTPEVARVMALGDRIAAHFAQGWAPVVAELHAAVNARAWHAFEREYGVILEALPGQWERLEREAEEQRWAWWTACGGDT